MLFGTACAAALALGCATSVLAAGGHSSGGGGSTVKTCSLSPAVVGGPLTISGTGYTPGAKYTIVMTWPYGGKGDLFATADSTGAWQTNTYAYWAGTYYAQVEGSKSAVLATCSETVG
jgi:hypothetical protein